MTKQEDRGPLSTVISISETEVDPQESGGCGSRSRDPNRFEAEATTDARLSIGARLSGRYRIERELAEGGMGVVYLVTDEQVAGEIFAVKVLKEGLVAEALSLLREEVRKTRKLSHPNIVDVHSVNVDSARLYVLMEYLEGKSLNVLLDEEFGRGMAFSHAWPIIEDVAAALGYAHDHNVIHSDLKPANIFLTHSGKTKLLDFGIARVTRRPLLHQRSRPLALTPAYASCEMLEGEDADPRDDIYSFACVIYEMLCGKRVFGELTALEAREAGAQVPPLGVLSREQNAALARALAFDRKERTASVEELLAGLAASSQLARSAMATAAPSAALPISSLAEDSPVVEPIAPLCHASFSPSPHSIAVLPFSNLTGSPDMDYLSDGMSEELIHKLTRVPGFRVPARTSSFAYKGKNVNVRDIARDLNVAAVIEGSVRAAGECIRVTAQLVDARSGYHVWSQTYDRQLADIFVLQDELAGAIVEALQGDKPSVALWEIISATPTHDIEAYQLYLQGNALCSQPSVTNIRKAIELCNRAIGRDPSFSRAMCTVALAHLLAAGNGWEALPSALAHAEQNAARALAIDSALADARGVLGVVHVCRRKWLEAEEHFHAALSVAEINPLTAQTHAIGLLASVGHLREAMREAERAYRVAPALASVLMVHAALHCFAGNDAEALKYTDFASAHGWPTNVRPFPHIRAQVAVRAARYSEAAQWIMEALSDPGSPTEVEPAEVEPLVTSVFRAYADPAARKEALAIMRKFFAYRGADLVKTHSLPRYLMHWSSVFGDLDLAYLVGNRALDYFDSQGAVRPTSFIPQLWIAELRAFRQDPRFSALVTRLGLPQYWQRYGAPDGHDIPE
jgi:serine/threonine-protein kinase